MKHLPLSFWRSFNARFPRTFLLGELLDGDPAVVARTWTEGGFSALFDFPLAFAMSDVFCGGASPAKLAAVLSNDRRYPDPSRLVTLVDNHDLPRVMSRCGGDVEKVKRALTFLFEARGIPSMAWGTEVGATGEREPANRASMRFVDHPLVGHVREALSRRRAHPSLDHGVPKVLSVDGDHLLLARVSTQEVALTCVWRAGSHQVTAFGQVVRCDTNQTTFLRGTFDVAALEHQWRTGAKTVSVSFSGPVGTRLVGSGAELGDWAPAKGQALPVTLELPEGGVFEFKLVRGEAGKFEWAGGENQVLFVQAGQGPVSLSWP